MFRGPDSFKMIEVGNYTLVFSRLAIIGSGQNNGWNETVDHDGDQPLVEKDRYIIANGEIYNYKELALSYNIDINTLRSDIDLLIKVENVEDLIPKLNADIAGVIYKESNIIAFRDPVGVKPLYVAWSAEGQVIGFASLKAALVGAHRIEEFPPGHIYTNNRFIRYTTPVSPHIVLPTVAKDGIYEHLFSSVRRRLFHSNVPVAFLCSGGVDSSIILSIGYLIWTLELHRSPTDLQVFTLEYKDEKCNATDTFYAKLLCKELNVKHTIISFTKADIEAHLSNIMEVIETDDYRTVRAAIPQYMLARYVRKNTPYRVLLSGEGADELFMGYNYFYLSPNGEAAAAESDRLINNLYRYDLLRADRVVSSWGLELRVPFLDVKFMRFVQAIDGNLRKSGEKDLLREAFKEIAALRTTRIIDRGKEKFSDGCGLSYIPDLRRVIAAKYIDVVDVSSHLLEKYEKQYAKEYFEKTITNCSQSNLEFRELPSWAEHKTSNMLVFEKEEAPTSIGQITYNSLAVFDNNTNIIDETIIQQTLDANSINFDDLCPEHKDTLLDRL